ncbi:MAG: hypothetical protein NZ951_02520 [Dehalococcoidia bacterium]|nr:hypothetical protein [Dehalococcoidia bacterium]MDW8119834.1 hypothetical protein [Chloroflexota bacterium]
MSALSHAIAQERWEVAAYLLLLGVLRTAQRLPPDALEDLLHALQGLETPEGTHGQ